METKRHEKMVALTWRRVPIVKRPQALEILKRYTLKRPSWWGKMLLPIQNWLNVSWCGPSARNPYMESSDLTKLPLNQSKKWNLRHSEAIYKATGIRPMITRPPYGAINSTVQNAVDQSFIMWSVDSLDWKHVIQRLLCGRRSWRLQPGSIILMHTISIRCPSMLCQVTIWRTTAILATVDELLENRLQPSDLLQQKLLKKHWNLIFQCFCFAIIK